ncbi:MAG: hypothetical protein WD100_03190 [Tistlia sp.]|uniref:hypothetical protein n=1 Tax=Tistlia sp. TaxID=3057121 RepID=UPI0034A4B37B
MLPPFFALSLQATRLALEAQQVIALRMLQLWSGDPRSRRESQRMITEKIAAATAASMTAATAIATGQSQSEVARRVLGGYSRKVRANRRRLGRS